MDEIPSQAPAQDCPCRQATPLARRVTEQVAVPLHALTWQGPAGVQLIGVPVQCPVESQASPWVHASPSLHDTPLLTGFEQAPVEGSQVPARWHWSSAVQVTWLDPTQAPAWQASVRVQRLPSLHGAPLALTGFEHPLAGLHVPAR